jgi:hypothetical protein
MLGLPTGRTTLPAATCSSTSTGSTPAIGIFADPISSSSGERRPCRYGHTGAVWKEGGKYPNVIIELLSPSAAEEDLTIKKVVYEQTFRTPEYYCYDPETHALQGWRLNPLTYEPIVPNEKGWMWSEQWKMWLGNRQGRYMNRDATWLRFYAPDGTLVPMEDEAARYAIAKLQEDAAAAEQRAAAAEIRAVAAVAELARLNVGRPNQE